MEVISRLPAPNRSSTPPLTVAVSSVSSLPISLSLSLQPIPRPCTRIAFRSLCSCRRSLFLLRPCSRVAVRSVFRAPASLRPCRRSLSFLRPCARVAVRSAPAPVSPFALSVRVAVRSLFRASAPVSSFALSFAPLHPSRLSLSLFVSFYCSVYTLTESSYCSSFKLSGVIFPARRSVKMRFLMIRAVGFVSYFNVVLRVIFCNDLVRMHSVQRNAHLPIGPCRAGTGRQILHSRSSCADPER